MMSTRKRAMSMADKMDELKSAGFTVRYADPAEGHANGYVTWSQVVDRAYAGPDDRPYVDLGWKDDNNDASTWDRSNFRSLVRDFPGLFVPTSYSNTDALGVFVHDVNEETLRMLIGLKNDYPIYDESDLSELESEEIEEAFDQYLFSDWFRNAPEEWTDVAGMLIDGRFNESDGPIREAFYEALSASDYYPEHDGHDIGWDDAEVHTLMTSALSSVVEQTFGARTPDTTVPLF